MSWRNIHWENMDFAWGFAAIIALVIAFCLLGWWKRHVRSTIADPSLLETLLAEVSPSRQRWKAFFLIIGCALLVLVVMRPKYGLKETTVTNTGIDIAIVLDVSKSMSVQDVVPTRLEAAKLEISDLLQELHGGRVSLVPFAGIPFVQTALTDDFDVIRMYLKDLRITDMPVPGTNLGRAMQVGLSTLTGRHPRSTEDEDAEIDQYSGSKHKAMILFTDGENHESAPVEVAAQAAQEGIKVYVVGVGTATGNPVPNIDENGKVEGFLRDEKGRPVISGLNESLLEDIAKTTGGAYFRYDDESIVDPLYSHIDQMEKQEYEERTLKLLDDRFQLFLLPVILLLALEILMGDRRWRRSSTRGSTAIVLLAVGSTLLPTSIAHATTPEIDILPWYMTTNSDVDAGNAHLIDGEGQQALNAYEEAGETLPWDTALHFNFGLAHLAVDDFKNAIDFFARSRNTAPSELHALISYNLGVAFARWGEFLETPRKTPVEESEGAETNPRGNAKKKWNAAIEAFERALALNPGDENTAWNLEVALVAICRLDNDEAEPNNRSQQATPVELAENPENDRFEGARELVLCMGDQDWFALELGPGDRLKVNIKVTEEDDAAGDGGVTVMLMDPTGTKVLAQSNAPESDPLELEHKVEAGERQVHLLRVRGVDENTYKVGLDFAVRPPCSSKEDPHEDNDRPENATELPGGIGENLRICPDDPDWFRVDLQADESLFAFASLQGEEAPDFDLGVFDADGKQIARSGTHEGSRIAAVFDPGTGTYFVKVLGGPETEANYQIALQVLPPCPLGNDLLEPNDRPEEASRLSELTQNTLQQPMPTPPVRPPGPAQPDFPPGHLGGPTPGGLAPGAPQQQAPQTALLRICEGDVDHIEVTIPPETAQIATILFDHRKGDLSIDLLDAVNHEALDRSDQSSDELNGESIRFPENPEEKNFLLKIRGKGWSQNFYLLRIDTPPPNQDQQDGEDDQSDEEDNKEKDEEDNKEEEEEDNEEEEKEEDAPQDEQQDKPDEAETQLDQKDIEQIEDILRQLDRNRENLEALDAMRHFRLPNPIKDW